MMSAIQVDSRKWTIANGKMQLAVRSFGQLERVDETVDEVDLVLRL